MVLASALGLLTIACGPPWQVIRQSVPNPLLGQRSFVIEGVHFESVIVGRKSEPEYLSGKDPQQIASWMSDKSALAGDYFAQLVAGAAGLQVTGPGPGAQGFLVRTIATRMEPGVFAVFVNIPTEVALTVQILDPNAQVIDEFVTQASEPATLSNPSSGGRLRVVAARLGGYVARYLSTRVSATQ